jgi:hypothetical protein
VQGDESTASRGTRERFLLMWGTNAATGMQTPIGPATVFRAVGPSLRLGPRGKEAALFHNGLWVRRKIGGRFPMLWTEVSTALRMENPMTGAFQALGTVDMIGVVRNVIYADRENSRPVAILDENTGLWRSNNDGQHWPELVILPVAAPNWSIELLENPPEAFLPAARPQAIHPAVVSPATISSGSLNVGQAQLAPT